MKEKPFHFRSYLHKKYNSQPHSCAVCRNQPIFFSRVPDHQRDVKPPAWQWKPGVRDRDIWGAEVDDVFDATTAHTDALKMPSKGITPISTYMYAKGLGIPFFVKFSVFNFLYAADSFFNPRISA